MDTCLSIKSILLVSAIKRTANLPIGSECHQKCCQLNNRAHCSTWKERKKTFFVSSTTWKSWLGARIKMLISRINIFSFIRNSYRGFERRSDHMFLPLVRVSGNRTQDLGPTFSQGSRTRTRALARNFADYGLL